METSSATPEHGLGRWVRREWRLLVGLALSVLCVYLAIRGVSLPSLLTALATAQWKWVVVAVLVVMAGTVLKAWRWQTLFFPDRIPFGRGWCVFLIGQMLNIVLPARAGEIGRIYYISQGRSITKAKALSTVVVEKMVDVAMLALAYGVAATWLATTPIDSQEWLRGAGRGLLPLAAVATAVLLLFAYAGRRAWAGMRRLLSPLPHKWQRSLDAAAGQMIGAFEVLRHGPTSAKVWAASLLIWVLSAWTNVLLFRAFQLPLPVGVALFLLVVLMSGVAVPPLPGNLGVFPYLSQVVLTLFGVERGLALAYGITLQAVAYLPLVLVGLACLIGENWRLPGNRARPGEQKVGPT